MRIGELSERTQIPTRMLRYYEAQSLLEAERASNGYRDYAEETVDRARRVRAMIQTGLSTRIVRIVLDLEAPCDDPEPLRCTEELATELADEIAAIELRMRCLKMSRDTLEGFLRQSDHAALLDLAT